MSVVIANQNTLCFEKDATKNYGQTVLLSSLQLIFQTVGLIFNARDTENNRISSKSKHITNLPTNLMSQFISHFIYLMMYTIGDIYFFRLFASFMQIICSSGAFIKLSDLTRMQHPGDPSFEDQYHAIIKK